MKLYQQKLNGWVNFKYDWLCRWDAKNETYLLSIFTVMVENTHKGN